VKADVFPKDLGSHVPECDSVAVTLLTIYVTGIPALIFIYPFMMNRRDSINGSYVQPAESFVEDAPLPSISAVGGTPRKIGRGYVSCFPKPAPYL